MKPQINCKSKSYIIACTRIAINLSSRPNLPSSYSQFDVFDALPPSLYYSMDSPGVKATYTATVVAPEWCTVLMSALADDEAGSAKGVFKWKQPVPTSAYLIALAAGNLDSREIRYGTMVHAFIFYLY